MLARHGGVHKFTVGQRRGLGGGSAEPLYVQRIEAASQKVVVGPAGGVERSSFEVLAPHWVGGRAPVDRQVSVRIRHKHAGAEARVTQGARGVRVELCAPARAVTPGQAAVFYDGERVLGGGFIASA